MIQDKLGQLLAYVNNIMNTPYRKRIFQIIGGSVGLFSIRYLCLYLYKQYKQYPPGPLGLPYFGSFFNCIDIPKYASYLSSNYGGVSMIYVGFQPYVFLHTIDAITQVFKDTNDASGRDWDKSSVFDFVSAPDILITFCPYKYWHEKRKDFASILLSKLDSQFINEVHNKSMQHIFKNIDNCIQNNKVWKYSDDIKYLTFNFIWYTAFGYFLPYQSKQQHKLYKLLDTASSELAIDIILRYLGIYKIVNKKYNGMLNLINFMEENIYKLKYNDTDYYDESIWDFNDKKWDAHFKKIKNDANKCAALKIIAHHRFKYLNKNYNARLSICGEIETLFGAGLATIIDSVEYGLVILAKYENIQNKIYDEIHQVFGEDKKNETILLKNVIHKLHYLRAFLHELLRVSSVAPIGVPRYNRETDICVSSYYAKNKKKYKCIIPKGSIIIADIPNANRNDKYWANGKDFNIKLWLDDDGTFQYNLHKEKLMTFSVGKRKCIGEAFAKRSLYLIFIKFIMNYKFMLPNNDDEIQIHQRFDFVWHMDPKIDLNVQHR